MVLRMPYVRIHLVCPRAREHIRNRVAALSLRMTSRGVPLGALGLTLPQSILLSADEVIE